MQRDLETRIREIQRMPTAELKQEWLRVFGAPPRSGNVQWMRKRLIHQAQVAVLGDLSPETKARLEELLPYAPLWVPMGKRSLANAITRTPAPAPSANGTRALPSPGTVLSRPYKGKTIQVLVREDGFEWDGRIFPTLTATVEAITGAHWNPSVFFNLGKGRKTA